MKHHNALIKALAGETEGAKEAMHTDWEFEFGESALWVVAPRMMLPPSELVAYISSPHDAHYRDLARVTQLSHGWRRHKKTGYQDKVVLAHLVTSSGDHGVWYIPSTANSQDNYYSPQHGFHPAPRFYFRRGHENNLFPAMHALGASLRELREHCAVTRGKTREENYASLEHDYKALFEEKFPKVDSYGS